ncbi:MAG: S-layer homology domain-containing protein [Oscillospiraceae bacterium]|nr:S-layer homology domain-containing protein [Oscillospiraceae bacterium]
MKVKRLLAITLSLVLSLALFVPSLAAVDTSNILDMPVQGNWNYDALEFALDNGILTSEGGYIRPQDNMSISEMYAAFGRGLGISLTAPGGSSGNATREAMFILMAELVGAELSSFDNEMTYINMFSDGSSVAANARTPIAALVKAGYIEGDTSSGLRMLYPKNELTRSEIALLAKRVFGLIVSSGSTISSDITGNVTVRSNGVSFNNAVITGDLIVGGGANTVTLNRTTVRGRNIVRGNTSLNVDNRSFVNTVHCYADLSYAGYATTINVRGNSTKVNVSNGELRSINVEGDNNTVTVGSSADVSYMAVSGNSNNISGTGSVGSVSGSGRSNKFEIAGATILGDFQLYNETTTKTGTFNITAADITGNTTISVTFDDKIEKAPAAAFTLSGTARSFSNNKSTPDSTSISSDGKTVTLTFTGASFNNIGYSSSLGTIAVTDDVIAADKAKLNTKSIAIGSGNYYYDPAIVFGNIKNSSTVTSIDGSTSDSATTSKANFEIKVPAASVTHFELAFSSGAYNISASVNRSGATATVHYNNYGGYNNGYVGKVVSGVTNAGQDVYQQSIGNFKTAGGASVSSNNINWAFSNNNNVGTFGSNNVYYYNGGFYTGTNGSGSSVNPNNIYFGWDNYYYNGGWSYNNGYYGGYYGGGSIEVKNAQIGDKITVTSYGYGYNNYYNNSAYTYTITIVAS